MNPWKLILATVVIFGAGVIMGGLLVNYAVHYHTKGDRHPAVSGSTTNHPSGPRPIVDVLGIRQPEILSQRFVQSLDEELQLTQPQRDAIHKIIACGQEQNRVIWTNCAAQSRQVLQEVRQNIREQLDPVQIKQFEKLLKQMSQMRSPSKHPAGTNSVPPVTISTNAPAPAGANVTATNSANAKDPAPAPVAVH